MPKSKLHYICQAQLRSGNSCQNRAQPKYNLLWCGTHARSRGYISVENSKHRIEFDSQPLACCVQFTDTGQVKLDVLTLESLQIYPHQFETATRTVSLLQNGDHHVLIAAEPQLGKTGTIQTICWMATRLNRNVNPIVILPMNDNDLAKQIATDYHGLIPSCNILNAQHLRNHLYLSKILDRDPHVTNWLIIDESHLGTTFTEGSTLYSGQNTLHRELATIGVNLNLSLVPSNVRLITVSATPMAETAALLGEGSYLPKSRIVMSRPHNYYGIREMHNAHYLIQSGPLRDEKWSTHFLEHLTSKTNTNPAVMESLNEASQSQPIICPSHKAGYIIVRVSNRNADSFKARIAETYETKGLPYMITDCHHKRTRGTVDFNELIEKLPPDNTHHFLLVYGRLRASKRLIHKHHLVAIHDYSKSCDATVQGLLGRLCGYYNDNRPAEILAFINLQVVLPYLHWTERDFSPQTVPDKSKNVKNGLTYQMLRRCARGFFPVPPVIVPLVTESETSSSYDWFRNLATKFQQQANSFYHNIADQVLDKFVSLSNGRVQRVTSTTRSGATVQTSNLLVDGVEYLVRSGNSMMFLTEKNSDRTVKQFENRYKNAELGVPVMPFTMSSPNSEDKITKENHYFLYLNLLTTPVLQPCLWLGLVEYRDDIAPICEHLEVKPESLYYRPELDQEILEPNDFEHLLSKIPLQLTYDHVVDYKATELVQEISG